MRAKGGEMKLSSWKEEGLKLLIKGIMSTGMTRKLLQTEFERRLHNKFLNDDTFGRPRRMQEDKFLILRALLRSALRNIDKGYFSRQVAGRAIDTLVKGAFMHEAEKAMRAYEKKYGYGPPSFLVISPTKACNLHCIGCYASSSAATKEKLPYDVVKRILDEGHDLLGMRFITISGGEPTMYKDSGKNILDVIDDHRDMFFEMFTNGTLINKKMAKRMAELGNVTPAISVEGFEKETDQRRGRGVFKQILNAFENLKEAGVPFGTSVTATRFNVDLLLTDEFYDYYFEEQGATYMWMFQYMPIGRSFTLSLMPTADERMKLYWKWREVVEKKSYFVADFWNSGVVSAGCIAYGRPGGYIYIDWNGNIMPCVFVPYYAENIKDIYRRGGNLIDALHSDFMEKGREWQFNYAYFQPKERMGNLLMPCSIRDHYANFKRIVFQTRAKPEDQAAELAIKDKDYEKGLIDYDRRLRELTEDLWDEMFLEKKKAKTKKPVPERA